MTLDEYQRAQQRTWNVDWSLDDQINNAILGLVGEAGEVAEWRKKTHYHGHSISRDVLHKELGDCLHYVSAIASLYGWSLEDIAAANIAKLQVRYPNGFSKEDSRRRADLEQ